MPESDDRKELQRRLDQARRMVAVQTDQLLISDLEEQLE